MTHFANSLRKSKALRKKLAQTYSTPPAHILGRVSLYSYVSYVTVDELSVVLSNNVHLMSTKIYQLLPTQGTTPAVLTFS